VGPIRGIATALQGRPIEFNCLQKVCMIATIFIFIFTVPRLAQPLQQQSIVPTFPFHNNNNNYNMTVPSNSPQQPQPTAVLSAAAKRSFTTAFLDIGRPEANLSAAGHDGNNAQLRDGTAWIRRIYNFPTSPTKEHVLARMKQCTCVDCLYKEQMSTGYHPGINATCHGRGPSTSVLVF
jgi:hypothetical protein